MKKTVIIFFLSSLVALAQSAGSSGLAFLKFGFGARNIAMGDAGSAGSNDLAAMYYNPSRLVSVKGNEVMFMHNEWIQDVRSEVGGIKWDMFSLPWAVGFNVTTVSDIEVRERPGEPISTFNANYFFGSLSSGFTIMDDSIIGGNFTIFVAPQDVVWAQGSTLIFGGKIDINDDTGEVRWRNHFILPTEMAMSRELQVKSVKGKETVDVSEEAEEGEPEENEDEEQATITEEKKEEPKEEVKEEKPKEEEKQETKKEEKKEEKEESEDDEGDIFKIDA